MPSSPLVSVCIPASRSGEMLRDAIASVLGQSHAHLEVVITDDTGGDLRETALATGDPRVTYHANEGRLGFSGNHMEALRRARGPYIAILHDDDELRPGFLTALLPPMEEDRTLGVAFGAHLRRERDGRLRPMYLPVEPGSHATFLPTLIRSTFMLPSGTLMRREIWDRSPHWPDNQIADYMMYIDAALDGWGFYYDPQLLMIYRAHDGQITMREESFRSALVEVWRRYEFEDQVAERLRVENLASALVARAGTHVKRGNVSAARADLAEARIVDAHVQRRRRIALRTLSSRPELVGLAQRAWRRLRGEWKGWS